MVPSDAATEQPDAQERAQDSAREARRRPMLKTMSDAKIVIDEMGTIVAFTAAAEKLFGYSKPDIVGGKIDASGEVDA